MSDSLSGPGLAEFRARFEAELTPAVVEFAEVAREAVMRLAGQDGWTERDSRRLAELALPPMLEELAAGVSPEQALDSGLRKARRALVVALYDEAIAGGSSRDVAFLMLVELESLLAGRRGESAARYPDALLKAGCQAASAAAGEGASSAEQIDTGFAMMRKLAAGG